MNILVIITARKGSKRLPGKNTRSLGGKPLILWTVDIAKKIPNVCDILISTDDPKAASICIKSGAYVPWLRPSTLSTDKASSVDVVIHALDFYEKEKNKVDGVLLLQPTSPFRKLSTIKEGINLFLTNNQRPVVGVSPTPAHPMWSVKIDNGAIIPFTEIRDLEIRSQELPPVFIVNGSFYLIKPNDLRERKSFIGNDAIPLIVKSSIESLDIDNYEDFERAEFVLSVKKT